MFVIDAAVFVSHGRLDCNAVGYFETHTIFRRHPTGNRKEMLRIVVEKHIRIYFFCGKKVINKEKKGFLFAVTLAKIISDD
ncbi:MAG TPA: hypothetical protein DHU79_06460 [Clostridiales bacterium]|nr:hypothetical protein [Clostridiales bacterium]